MARVVKQGGQSQQQQNTDRQQQDNGKQRQKLPVFYPRIGVIAICVRDSKYNEKYGFTTVVAKVVSGRLYDGKKKEKVDSKTVNGLVVLKIKDNIELRKGDIFIYGSNVMDNLVLYDVEVKSNGKDNKTEQKQ